MAGFADVGRTRDRDRHRRDKPSLPACPRRPIGNRTGHDISGAPDSPVPYLARVAEFQYRDERFHAARRMMPAIVAVRPKLMSESVADVDIIGAAAGESISCAAENAVRNE